MKFFSPQSGAGSRRDGSPLSRLRWGVRRFKSAFTLVEMLTVIAIIGIIAALTVPALKNFGKSDVNVSASRQLLDDIGRARQLAMSDRTTVYMVFVPTNFWTLPNSTSLNSAWWGSLTPIQQTNAINLLDKQLMGYNFLAYGAVGDQPGDHQWHYLAQWQSLPDGSFIPLWKFYNSTPPPNSYTYFKDPFNANYWFQISAFGYTNTFPFPTEDSTNFPTMQSLPYLPYIAFNYLGQLADYSGNMLTPSDPMPGLDYDQDFVGGGVDIPLAQGSVIPYRDPTTHALLTMASSSLPGSPQVVEDPQGNSTNGMYNVIHIDPLTGRATLEYHKMQ